MARMLGKVAALLALLATAADAAFHIAVIDEVMSGAAGNPNVQYVEVRQLFGGQNNVCHTRLTVFRCQADGGGSVVLIDNLGGAGAVQPCVPDGTSGARWLMASPDGATFLAASGVTPDAVWNAGVAGSIPPSCGMVCWGAPGSIAFDPPTFDATNPGNYVDCVAYGPYDGTPPPLGHSAASDVPGDGTFSLTRTGDVMFSNDFHLACPTPTSNPAQTTGDFGPCTPPATTTTTVSVTITTTSTFRVTTTTFRPGTGQTIAGTRLLLFARPGKPAKNLLALVAKDASIRLGDPRAAGGSLRLFTAAGDHFDATYVLPPARWKPIGRASAPKGYRFRDAAGPIRTVMVKGGKLLKATGRGAQLGEPLGANPDPVTVILSTGTERYCMTFGGGQFVTNRRYLARGDPAPAACP
jgi:hypothetical protein